MALCRSFGIVLTVDSTGGIVWVVWHCADCGQYWWHCADCGQYWWHYVGRLALYLLWTVLVALCRSFRIVLTVDSTVGIM